MRRSHLLLLLLAAVFAGAAAQSIPDAQPSDPCDRLDQVPSDQRCSFILEKCESEGGLPYTQWYYCHVAPRGAAARFFFTILLAALLPLFFTLLGDTAEVYFSPIMTHVSQSIPKMRPRFAGVTFVAMGNGATDLSANITAIRKGKVLLSAGALTGAAMFVQCVVASEVMRASRGPVKCCGATLRDVGMYIASVVLVLASFAHGRITYWFIVGAVLLYLTYAMWVFVGDEWHERGRPEASSVWRSFRNTVSGRLGPFWGRQTEDLLPWAQMDVGLEDRAEHLMAPLVAVEEEEEEARVRDGGRRGGGITSRPSSPGAAGQVLDRQRQDRQPHHHLMSAKAYQEMVWADLSSDLRAGGGGGASAAAAGGGGGGARRRRRRSLQRPSRHSRGEGGVELGIAAGSSGEPSGVRHGSVSPHAAGGGVRASQLLTLSSLNGSALPAPVPVHGAPFRTLVPPGGGLKETSTAAGGGGGMARQGQAEGTGAASAVAVRGLPAPSGLLADPWSGEAFGGESDLSEEEEKEEVGDEEVGLLGSRRHRSRVGDEEGDFDDDDDDDDVASLAPSACPRDPGHQRRGLWSRLRYELTVGTSAEWEQLPPSSLRRRWRAFTFPPLLPVYAALRFTIPFVDPATYSRRWLVATCVGAPLLAATYLAPGSWLAAALAAAVGGALAAGVAYFTAGEEDALPDWDFGTGFAFGPAFFALFGFFMGIVWIDLLASQVVGVIALLASLLRLPASVMGLTLLAWGNSLGDFFGNPAMARRGKPTMALTACFAGPLFNMLMSMAFGFGSYFAQEHVAHREVELPPEVTLGCVFLVLYNVAVAVAGLMNRGALPERFYVFARGWYVVYLAAACIVGLWPR